MIKIMKLFCVQIAAFTIQHSPVYEDRDKQLNASTAFRCCGNCNRYRHFIIIFIFLLFIYRF